MRQLDFLIDSVTRLLACNNYVVVVALDFSKAFDSVRHSTLLTKMAQLDLPDAVFNSLVDYFRGHEHCTQYNGVTSAMLPISASIVQGLAVGPASYVVNAADLTILSSINQLVKHADDTYLVIPASNVERRAAELDHVEQWAAVNRPNLRLNRDKCTEIIFVDGRSTTTSLSRAAATPHGRQTCDNDEDAGSHSDEHVVCG